MDNVNHPAHYESSCSLECIDAMKIIFGPYAVINFCACNAWKYIWRWKNKNGIEDLNKAEWYINTGKELSNGIKDDSIILLDRMHDYIISLIQEERSSNESSKN
jgi:hypothetical protein